MIELFREYQGAIQSLERSLSQLQAATVTRESLLQAARKIVDQYFRETKLHILSAGVGQDDLLALDRLLQQLLSATHRRTPTKPFRKIVKAIKQESFEVEKRLLAAAGAQTAEAVGDSVDKLILETLKSLLPSAALAYEQAVLDISASSRLSWRGPATDFREALRETLDHLAPDTAVTSQQGYKQEPHERTHHEAKSSLHFAPA